jgi:uncharacterized Zn finger protein
MEITILVKSSSQSDPRSVLVVLDDSGLSFVCDCPAGERGRICKHKKALASVDDSMLFDEDQRENFKQVANWVAQSGYSDLMKELKEVESELDSAREKARDIKEKITRVMKEGLK